MNQTLQLPPLSPSFSPPNHEVWVNTLWFLSLVISLNCALLATLLQQWARRYLKIIQSRYSPHKRVPENTFPKQLYQAIAVVQHFLDTGTAPSKLILAGNSAVSNLTLNIVAQLLDPHWLLPTPPADPLRFCGLLLLSPWIEFGTDAPSHTRNQARDVLPLCTYRLFVDGVMPGVTPELRAHLELSFATSCGRWRWMGCVVQQVLVVAGKYAGLIDTIEETAHAIGEELQDTTVFVLPGGIYGDLIQEFGAGEDHEYKFIVSWLAKTL